MYILQKIGEINLSINLKHEELLVVNDRERSVLEEYQTLERIPSGFWRSKVIENLPVNFSYRRRTCNELFDSEHWKICTLNDFHTHSVSEECVCMFCNNHCEWYHSCL